MFVFIIDDEEEDEAEEGETWTNTHSSGSSGTSDGSRSSPGKKLRQINKRPVHGMGDLELELDGEYGGALRESQAGDNIVLTTSLSANTPDSVTSDNLPV